MSMKVTILMPAMRGVMHVPDPCATFRFSTAGLPEPARAEAVRYLHQRERTMLPAGLEPAAPLPASLRVSVSGPWARLRSLDASDLGPVVIDLSRTGAGAASWFVRPESLRLPVGVRVESLSPSQGIVQLQREGP